MKAIFNRASLLEAFSAAASVVAVKSPMLALHNVKLVVNDQSDGAASLIATDLEVSINRQCLGVKIEKPGQALLPAQKMLQILRLNTSEEVALEIKGDLIHVKGLGSEIRLPSDDPATYPEIQEFAPTDYYVVNSHLLKTAIRRTSFACGIGEGRYALDGLLFDPDSSGVVSIVATDGRRLSQARAESSLEGSPVLGENRPVVPIKAVKLIDRNLDDDIPIHIAFPDANTVMVRTDQAVITSRLLNGKFPKYKDILPKSTEHEIQVPVGHFRNRMELASIATSNESRGLDFAITDGNMILSGQAADVGKSEVTMPIDYQGENVTISLDPGFVIDGLKAFPENTVMSMGFTSNEAPVVLYFGDEFRYVVMPLTTQAK